ncbi:MAG: hypothetical protein ACD_22C00081G0001, partial [uncultured bacterium]
GHPTIPFSMEVDWDMITNTKKDPEVARKIRELSRMKYGRPAAEVEEFINLRAGANEPEIPEPKFGGFDKGRIPF